MPAESRYTIPSLERFINRLIGFIFYYRLLLVFLSMVAIVILSICVYNSSDVIDKLKNVAIILTGGSIIIGIFYSIINYEHNQIKFNHDKKSTRETLTFNTACRMHETAMVSHIKNVKLFYLNNKELFISNKHLDVAASLAEQEETRISFIIVFNYFEGIALAINQGIIDETFMKKFFKSVFRDHYNFYGSHFLFLRKENNSPDTCIHFTNLASKWIDEH